MASPKAVPRQAWGAAPAPPDRCGTLRGAALGIKFLVDEAIVPQDRRLLFLLLAGLLVATLVVSAAAIARDWFYAYVGAGVLNDLDWRCSISCSGYRRRSRTEPSRRHPGPLHDRSRGRREHGQHRLAMGNDGDAQHPVEPGGLFALQWQLALLTLVAVPLSLLAPACSARGPLPPGTSSSSARPRSRAPSRNLSQVNTWSARSGWKDGCAKRSFGSWRSLGVEAGVSTSFRGSCSGRRTSRWGSCTCWCSAEPRSSHFEAQLSIGSLVSFDLVFLNFEGGVASLTEVAPSFLRASGGLARIEELLAEQPSVQDPEKPLRLPSFARAITFKDVSFGYAADS